ncbi:unnamed protein product [Acanthoscelides obtectus]|uniref:Uncharacterized protein n=1 Tax=Acanthoscelides obtectus TaxID=200917 RepID=A0A9P0LSS3_ACAOB|nr:unnamed protein product [Acanthoscelides obtectus]CAK1667130.1 hypothetical protein AOBTE_LOCUS25694 [Acanthoscelides obtectus]
MSHCPLLLRKSPSSVVPVRFRVSFVLSVAGICSVFTKCRWPKVTVDSRVDHQCLCCTFVDFKKVIVTLKTRPLDSHNKEAIFVGSRV